MIWLQGETEKKAVSTGTFDPLEPRLRCTPAEIWLNTPPNGSALLKVPTNLFLRLVKRHVECAFTRTKPYNGVGYPAVNGTCQLRSCRRLTTLTPSCALEPNQGWRIQLVKPIQKCDSTQRKYGSGNTQLRLQPRSPCQLVPTFP